RDTLGIVTDPPLLGENADIDLDDVPLEQFPLAAYAVDDLLVDGDAGVGGKALVSEEGALAGSIRHEIRSRLVEFAGGDPGAHQSTSAGEHLGGNGTSLAKPVQ